MVEVMKLLTERLQNPPLKEVRSTDSCYVSSASAHMKNLWGEDIIEGDCLRRQWYRMTGTTPDEASVYGRQQAYGDVVSEFEADLAKQAGIYLGHEISMTAQKEGVRIRGRADLMVEVDTPSGGKQRIGVEFKSVGSYHARRGTIITPKGIKYFPKIQHALQAAIYLDYWKNHGFDHWQIIYIDRAQGDYSDPSHKVLLTPEGDISVNGELIGVNMRDVYNRYGELHKYLMSEEVPPREFELEFTGMKLQTMAKRGLLSQTDRKLLDKGKLKKGDWQCEYCEFKKTCWKLKNEA